MLACVRSAAVFGIDAVPVTSRSTSSFGLPGLDDCRVAGRQRPREPRPHSQRHPEFRLRVPAASHHRQPRAGRRSEGGSSFDLPIALGVLAASGVIARRDVDDVLILGELSLDGGIQAARGVLPIAAAARRRSIRGLLLPARNSSEAAVVDGPATSIPSIAHRSGRGAERSAAGRAVAPSADRRRRTETVARRLLRRPRPGRGAARARDRGGRRAQRRCSSGPPGSGKTMMAKRAAGFCRR